MKPEYIVYSKLSCAPCQQAEQLLKNHNQNYTKLILDEDFDIIELYKNVPKSCKSFPAILKDGVFIGGLSDLQHELQRNLDVPSNDDVTSNDDDVKL